MDAIILVGGQGTRLRPLTARRHKSLLPLGRRRVFDFLLDWAAAGGVRRVVLALGRNNEDLAAAYPPGRRIDGLTVSVVTEREPLQSGGAIRNAVAEAGIEGRFVVLNGDVFLDVPLHEIVAAHEEAGAVLTIALHREDDARQYGVATVDDRGLITRFVEKSPEPPSNLVNAGAWVFEPGLVGEIPPGAVRVEETLFPTLVEAGRPVRGLVFDGLWADVGTPARYHALAMALLDRGDAGLDGSIRVRRGAAIERSMAGPGCVLEPAAAVRSSVLWENVSIGEGAVVDGSVLADGVSVGPGARLRECVAGPGVHVAAGAIVPPGTVIAEDAVFGGTG